MYARRYMRSYFLLAASLLCTSTRPIKLIARSAYPIPRFFLFYHQASLLSFLKHRSPGSDTFSSFIPSPHHVCFATPCTRRKHSSSPPPTFSLSPKFAVRSSPILQTIKPRLLPLPRDTARATSLPTLSWHVHSQPYRNHRLRSHPSVPQM